MTRKKFIKQLMAMGISRNTAAAVADAANRVSCPLRDMAVRIQHLLRECIVGNMAWYKGWRRDFDYMLRFVAERAHRGGGGQ